MAKSGQVKLPGRTSPHGQVRSGQATWSYEPSWPSQVKSSYLVVRALVVHCRLEEDVLKQAHVVTHTARAQAELRSATHVTTHTHVTSREQQRRVRGSWASSQVQVKSRQVATRTRHVSSSAEYEGAGLGLQVKSSQIKASRHTHTSREDERCRRDLGFTSSQYPVNIKSRPSQVKVPEPRTHRRWPERRCTCGWRAPHL
jgi:hypothetical protein